MNKEYLENKVKSLKQRIESCVFNSDDCFICNDLKEQLEITEFALKGINDEQS